MLQYISMITVSLLACIVAVHGLKCYECNTGIMGNSTDGYSISKKSECVQTESPFDNCTACQKIDSNVQVRETRSKVIDTRIISKLCVQSDTDGTVNKCENEGSPREKSVVCFCYSDLCNSAGFYVLSPLVVAVATTVLAARVW